MTAIVPISGLPAGVALTGAEVAPFTQGATTVKITSDQISARALAYTPNLGAAVALTGTEVLPAIQSGAAVKATVDQIATRALSFTGAWNNARLSKSAAYLVVNADKGSTIALAGNAFYTLTFGAASGYDANFTAMIINDDAGRGKTIACNGLSSFILWPGQSCFVFNDNNVWKINPSFQRWKVPHNTTIYIDAINGVDTNDGLAAGSGGAVKTFNQAIRVNIKDLFDLSGASSFPTACITVQLADNATAGVAATPYSLAHIAFDAVGAEGRCAILIQGNAGTPSNVVVSDSGGANIGCYGACNVELRNFQIGQTGAATPVANSCIEAADGANIRLQGGMIFGTATGAILQADNGGKLFSDGNFSSVGNAAFLINAFAAGTVSLGSSTVTFANSPTFSQQTISFLDLSLVQVDSVTWTNGGTVTATKYNGRGNSVLVNGSGSGAGIPGAGAGNAVSGAQVF